MSTMANDTTPAVMAGRFSSGYTSVHTGSAAIQSQTSASKWQTQTDAAAIHMRYDSAHIGPPAPMALLQWTNYVLSHPETPSPPSNSQLVFADTRSTDWPADDSEHWSNDRLQLSSNVLANEPVDALRVPAQRAAAISAEPQTKVALPSTLALRSSDTALGVHRQRFYPAQWKASLVTQVDALLREHGQSMRWEGWDRSLPRLYLPVQQLNRLVLDLVRGIVRRAPSPRFRGDELRLGIRWQSGSAQTIELIFDHPGFELSAGLIAALNAPQQAETLDLHASGGGEFLRMARTVATLGGSMSVLRPAGPVNALPGSSAGLPAGNGFRISLPIDHRESLVRAWIEQVSTASGNRQSLLDIHLFIVGRRQPESLSELQAADARLQSLASGQDYLYRAGYGRWLWLTTAQVLPTFVSREPWQSQRVIRWKCPANAANYSSKWISLDSRFEAFNHSIARRELAALIAREMDRLIGYRVPPIDCLVPTQKAPSAARSGRWRIDAANSLPAHHSPSSKRKRWRYPI